MSSPWEETWRVAGYVVRTDSRTCFISNRSVFEPRQIDTETLHLASAAPELFRALDGLMRAVLDDEAPGHAVSHALIAAHAAIRKARGES